MILQIDSNIQLHPLTLDDSGDIFNTIDAQRKYLGKWLPFVAFTKELKDTQAFVESVVNAPDDKFEYTFTIRHHSTFAGIIGFKDTDKLNRKTEIGYWLSENFQGKGMVTQSVKKLCDFAFDEQKINRIQIKVATGNLPSKKIPQRLGFKFEGIERDGEILTGGIFTDLEVYSKLKGD